MNRVGTRDAMKKNVPNDPEFEAAFATARVSRPHLARYYLRALEKTAKGISQPEYAPQTKSTCLFSGSSRIRLPVAAKMALASAGAAGGTVGSPMPRTSLVFVSARTSISGAW